MNLVPITLSWPEVKFLRVFLGSNWQADSKIYCKSKDYRIANTIWRIYTTSFQEGLQSYSVVWYKNKLCILSGSDIIPQGVKIGFWRKTFYIILMYKAHLYM